MGIEIKLSDRCNLSTLLVFEQLTALPLPVGEILTVVTVSVLNN